MVNVKSTKNTTGAAATGFNRYYNVCLVLDDDTANELCTDAPTGFDGINSDIITWRMPTNEVKKVGLVFRSSDNAQIAEMKIYHNFETIIMPPFTIQSK